MPMTGMQDFANIYGRCERCGAPKAPVIVGNGQMLLCTKCTSTEDQQAQLDFIKLSNALAGQSERTEK